MLLMQQSWLRAGILVITACSISCGQIADKDRWVVAEMDGEPIRRGDLMELIRNMSDEERPLIQNRGDLERTLNKWIDDQIKGELAKTLKSEGVISVDREVARAAYFVKHPEYMSVDLIQDPEALEMTRGDIAAVKAEIEFSVDEEEERLLREEALLYKMMEAARTKAITITPEQLQREYKMLEHRLIKFEYVDCIAIQFPLNAQGATQEAGKVRRRLQTEEFDAVLADYPGLGARPYLENDPSNAKFRGFWEAVSGCKVGDILGPAILPPHDQYVEDGNGNVQRRTMPAALLVLEVIDHESARKKTFEEALQDLNMSILRREVMQLLRDERGVSVYPDELPRPEGFGDQFKDQMIRTTPMPQPSAPPTATAPQG